MKIGVFDSGLGGLNILKSLRKKMPQIDYVYYGDTKNAPFGSKTQKQIYTYTQKGVEFLFQKHCSLVLIMCNTASTRALRKLQKEYLPKNYPNRRILGPIIPTVQAAAQYTKVGVVATRSAVDSKVFLREFNKFAPGVRVYQNAAPKVVPALEQGDFKFAEAQFARNLLPWTKLNLDAVILGSTHFALLKATAKKVLGKNTVLISADDVVPRSLKKYLNRHQNIQENLSKKGTLDLYVSAKTKGIINRTEAWFGPKIRVKKV